MLQGHAKAVHRASLPATILATYWRLLPDTTRQTGRCSRSSRWWLTQNLTRKMMGSSITCSICSPS